MTSAARLAQRLVDDQRRKKLETLRVQLALKGHELVQMADGSYCVGRWGLWRNVGAGLESVAAFARQVGADQKPEGRR